MASVMAIVSKAVFEKAARELEPGDCWDVDHYSSQNKGLAPLAEGGDLYLVTVRPPETLWLVAVLKAPKQAGDGWRAATNEVAIRAIDALRSKIKFTSAVGITAKAGALGMSLQTPRVLTDDDVALLAGARSSTKKTMPPTAKAVAAKKTAPTTKPAPRSAATKPAASAKKTTPPTPAKPEKASLATAVAQVAAGAWPDALASCLAVWRMAPNRELADVIVQLGAARPTVAIDAKKWLAIANAQAPETLDGLLATILDKGSVQARERVEALVEWPLDPRIDRWVAELFKAPPYTSTGARPFWTRVQPLTKRIADGAAIETIMAARKSKKVSVYDFLAEYIDKAQLAVKPDSPTAPTALAAIKQALAAASTKPPTSKRADAVLEEFLANPSNDDALVPLADALIEAGDPRGELITAQLDGSPAAIKRAAEIIKSERDALLGPLSAALVTDVTFRRGFAVAGKIRRGSSSAQENAIAKSVGHVLWSTIEHLEGPDDYEVSRHPIMRSLKSLAETEVPLAELAKMSRLEALDCGTIRGDADSAPVFDTGFPALRRLAVVFTYGKARALAKQLLEGELAQRLDAIDVGVTMGLSRGYEDYERLRKAELAEFAALVTPAARLGNVTVRGLHSPDQNYGSTYELTRDGKNLTVSIKIKAPAHVEPAIAEDVLAMLDAIAKIKAVEVSLDGPPVTKSIKKQIDDRISALRTP